MQGKERGGHHDKRYQEENGHIIKKNAFSSDVKSFMNHLEKKEWVYRNLKMEGSQLTPEQTENLLTGQYVLASFSVGAPYGSEIGKDPCQHV